MKSFGCLLMVLASALFLFFLGWAILQDNWAWAAIDSQLYRARVSSRADLMADRLDELVTNMERWGVTSGYSDPILHNPTTDVGLDYQAIKDTRSRARKLAELDQSSAAYQTGLADMRQTLSEIQTNAPSYLFFHSWQPLAALASLVLLILRLPSPSQLNNPGPDHDSYPTASRRLSRKENLMKKVLIGLIGFVLGVAVGLLLQEPERYP